MKHHHSKRELPAGKRASFALRPKEFDGGLDCGGRKGVLLVQIVQRDSAERRAVRRAAAHHCILLEQVQEQGACVGLWLATGEPEQVLAFAARSFVRRWQRWASPTSVDVLPLEDFSGETSVKIGQPRHETPRMPLPPLPACGWMNGK